MANKKRTKPASATFANEVSEIEHFIEQASREFGGKHKSWCYDYAIIRLYQQFERFMLQAMVAAINNDTTSVSQTLGISLPKHLTDEVCEYLVTGTGYFDFKGRSGLIDALKKYFPESHYLVKTLKNPKYNDAIEKLCALRNFATHASQKAKKAALSAVKQKKIGPSGSWLKVNNRFKDIANSLGGLAKEISAAAAR
jgi:hypothetical protein